MSDKPVKARSNHLALTLHNVRSYEWEEVRLSGPRLRPSPDRSFTLWRSPMYLAALASPDGTRSTVFLPDPASGDPALASDEAALDTFAPVRAHAGAIERLA